MPVFTDPSTGERWRRLGECIRCGECCKGTDPSIKNPQFTDEERAARQFCDLCPLLRQGSDDKFSCAGHGEHPYYLSGCQDHPRSPAELELTPSCSFTFERVD